MDEDEFARQIKEFKEKMRDPWFKCAVTAFTTGVVKYEDLPAELREQYEREMYEKFCLGDKS